VTIQEGFEGASQPDRKTRCRRIAWLAACLSIPIAALAESSSHEHSSADVLFESAINQLRNGAADSALEALDRLVARYPNFRLAHLVRGDLLLARVRPISTLGNTGYAARDRLEELRAEAGLRVRAVTEQPPVGRVPRYLLKMSGGAASVLIVDTSRARVFVYEVDGAATRLVRDFYTTIGRRGIEKEREGDQKTPVGVYAVTSWIPGAKLPDLYGRGAFPIDYPNARDRLLGRTGYGIWIHGVPSETYARAPRASDGCVALANPDLEALAAYVRPGTTPVVIAREIEWVTPAELRAERDTFLAQLEAWRRDWESGDTERYLTHYADTFRSNDKDLERWKAHKRRVNASKRWIKVTLSNLNVLRDPGAQDLISVRFVQNYRSDGFSGRTRKRQYWTREGRRWRIVYEAPEQASMTRLPESYPAVRASEGS